MLGELLRPPVVLVYHGIGGSAPSRLLTPVDLLERHVRWLRRRGYGFAAARDLDPASPPRRATAVLTFDDGWRNWLTDALPSLLALQVPATFYVCPGLWGGQQPDVPGPDGRLLERDEALALHEAGMELGAHSLTHADLRQLGDTELEAEVRGSKDAVEELTGVSCSTFAYPFGLHDDRVERVVERAGFAVAFGWLPGDWRRYAAPRLPAPPRRGATALTLKMYGIRRRWGR
jgi:peptidoglycan/xylan/chitin deacetylase (PgdA/CDA1 family)